jgi:inorganic pyrophosphatase
MNLSALGPGRQAPHTVNVVIEIPAHQSQPVKYEVDKESGALVVDRFMATPMFYPCHYGFIPQTLGGDGDPIDVLVWSPYSLQAGCVISCRVVGMLEMTDESGEDMKIIAVPDSKICPQMSSIENLSDLPADLLSRIKHFFEHYKDLEPGKWVKITGFTPKDKALEIIRLSIIAAS